MIAVHATALRERVPGLSAVPRFLRAGVEPHDVLGIARVAADLAVIPRGAVGGVHLAPRRARIVAPERPAGVPSRMDDRVHGARLRSAHAQADASEVTSGEPFRQAGPGPARVAGLEDPALGTGGQESILPAFAFHRRRVEDVRIGRIHREVDEAGVLADLVRVGPGLPAIRGLVEPALAARGPQRSHRGDVHHVRIAGVDHDASNVLGLRAASLRTTSRHHPWT